MTTQVQKFADQVVAAAKRAVTSMQVPTVVWGTVTAIGSGTVSFAPQGSTVSLAGIGYLDGYTPKVGDTVVAHKVGTDLFILGKRHTEVPQVVGPPADVVDEPEPAHDCCLSKITSSRSLVPAGRAQGRDGPFHPRQETHVGWNRAHVR